MHVATLRLLITLVLTLWLWSQLAWAATFSWDFETGTYPAGSYPGGPMDPNLVPPVVLSEGGNHLGRLTASPSDCGEAFQTTCPQTRAEAWMSGLPDVIGESRTYTVSVRIPSSGAGGSNTTAHTALVWQVFEGDYPISARDIWIGVENGRLYLANQVRPIPQTSQTVPLELARDGIAQVVELGALVYDQWNTYIVTVLQSLDPATGSVSVKKNGVQMGAITGQPTKYYVNHTDIYLDVVDRNGTLGIADFDNVQISTGGSTGDSTPPAPPTALRVQ